MRIISCTLVFYSLCYDISKKVKISISENCHLSKLFFQYYFSVTKVCPGSFQFNLIRPWRHRLKARQFKTTTILELLKVLVPYFMIFSSQIFCITSEIIGLGRASLVSLCSCSSRALPTA